MVGKCESLLWKAATVQMWSWSVKEEQPSGNMESLGCLSGRTWEAAAFPSNTQRLLLKGCFNMKTLLLCPSDLETLERAVCPYSSPTPYAAREGWVKSPWWCQVVLAESQKVTEMLRLGLAEQLCWIWPFWEPTAEIWPRSAATPLLVEDYHVKNHTDNTKGGTKPLGWRCWNTNSAAKCLHLLADWDYSFQVSEYWRH